MARRAITSNDIAAAAGVSQPTVSIVLNNRGDEFGIRAETQQRIIEAAKKLKYVRNPLASGLRGGRTSAIGMLWPLQSSMKDMAREMALRLMKSNYAAYMVDNLGDVMVTSRAIADFSRRGVDGIIVQGQHSIFSSPKIAELIAGLSMPIVLVSTDPTDAPVDVIHHDRLPAFRAVADHLAGAGRKRTVIVSPVKSNEQKVKALSSRLVQLGLAAKDQIVLDLKNLPHSYPADAARAVEELIARKTPFDAVVCTSDAAAAAVMRTLQMKGLRVPEDVAVIGANNSEYAPYLSPPLASIDHNSVRLADLMEEMLWSRLKDPQLPRRTVEISMQFVWRESAG
jgi:LacI family transcriptional regulator